eukprot:XP_001702728.1 tail-specific protease [Chlamydomonas reinhardtii]
MHPKYVASHGQVLRRARHSAHTADGKSQLRLLPAPRASLGSQAPSRRSADVPSRSQRAAQALLAGLASAAITLAPLAQLLPPPPRAHAEGEPMQIRFPASKDPEIRGAQEILVQAWGYVREYFYDPTFNRQDWDKRLQEALVATFKARDRGEALKQVEVMLGYLGDPFTRVLLPGGSGSGSGSSSNSGGSSEEFTSAMQAKIITTGLLVGRNEGAGGPLRVEVVLAGSPAEAAGVREGDEVVAVNGRPVGHSPDSALLDALSQDLKVDIKRVGYIRIVAFTDNVAQDVQAALAELQAAGCGSWLLDLRENPGGIVREGLDVAELLLPPAAPFAVVTGRSGQPVTQYLSEDSRALIYGQPIAVLVDRYSASTSELLAGALRDNARALLVGERTFGKGRTQWVVELSGGATLLVSTDTYTTPALRPVDHVGLPPDLTCRVARPPPPVTAASKAARAAAAAAAADAAATAAGAGDAGATAAGGGGAGVEVARFGGSGVVLQRGFGAAEVREEMRVGDVGSLQRDACVRAAVAKLSRAA